MQGAEVVGESGEAMSQESDVDARWEHRVERFNYTIVPTEPTTPEEYDDPAEYDLENGLDGPELPFYLSLAQATGGPVLDLACGTGFLTIPLARLGLAVTGVDLAPGMLDHARSKAGGLPIRWLHADCRALDLGERFRLITLTGNAFQAFLTRADQQGLLGGVARHLASDGRFAFETRFPRPSALFAADVPDGAWSAEAVWHSYVNAHRQTVTVSTMQRHDALRHTPSTVAIRSASAPRRARRTWAPARRRSAPMSGRLTTCWRRGCMACCSATPRSRRRWRRS